MKNLEVNYEDFEGFLGYLEKSQLNNFKVDVDKEEYIVTLSYSSDEELKQISKELAEILLYTYVEYIFKKRKQSIDDIRYSKILNACKKRLYAMSFYFVTILKLNIYTYFYNNSILCLESFLNFNLPSEIKTEIENMCKKIINSSNLEEFNINTDALLEISLSKFGYEKEDFSNLYIRYSEKEDTVYFSGQTTIEFNIKNTKKDFGFTIKRNVEKENALNNKFSLQVISLGKIFDSKHLNIVDDELRKEISDILGEKNKNE